MRKKARRFSFLPPIPVFSVLLTSGTLFLLAFGSDGTLLAQQGKGKGAPAKQREEKDTAKEKEEPAFRVMGKLGKHVRKTDFYQLNYTQREGRKRVKKKVWLKIPEGIPVFLDRIGSAKELKEGDSIYIFGRPEEKETVGPGGVVDIERVIRRGKMVAAGKGIRVNEKFKDPKEKGLKWCEVAILKPGASPVVSYEGSSYHVALDRRAPVVIRQELEKPGKLLRSGAQVIIEGDETSEMPESKRKSDPKEAYEVKKIIILYRVARYYGNLLSI